MLSPHINHRYKSNYILNYVNQIVTYQEHYYLVKGPLTFTHSSGIKLKVRFATPLLCDEVVHLLKNQNK
jgi:hypothetical protein